MLDKDFDIEKQIDEFHQKVSGLFADFRAQVLASRAVSALDLEPTGQSEPIDNDLWLRAVKTLFLAEGWDTEKITNSITLPKRSAKKLKDLEGIKVMMLNGEMGLDVAVSQTQVGEIEKQVITEFALKKGIT